MRMAAVFALVGWRWSDLHRIGDILERIDLADPTDDRITGSSGVEVGTARLPTEGAPRTAVAATSPAPNGRLASTEEGIVVAFPPFDMVVREWVGMSTLAVKSFLYEETESQIECTVSTRAFGRT